MALETVPVTRGVSSLRGFYLVMMLYRQKEFLHNLVYLYLRSWKSLWLN